MEGGKEGSYHVECIEVVTLYVMKSDAVIIYLYDVISDSWFQLPDCVHKYSSIAVINGCLTTVGGGSYANYYNELFDLTGKGSDGRWTLQIPPLSCCSSLAIRLSNWTTTCLLASSCWFTHPSCLSFSSFCWWFWSFSNFTCLSCWFNSPICLSPSSDCCLMVWSFFVFVVSVAESPHLYPQQL